MNEDLFIEGEITIVKPCATYEGRVYDQAAGIRLSKGTEMELFDAALGDHTSPIATAEMVGHRVRVNVRVFLAKTELLDHLRYGGYPVGFAELYGRIENILVWRFNLNLNNRSLDIRAWLDLGIGKVEIDAVVWSPDPIREIGGRELKAGDFVCVRQGRLDILEIAVLD